MSKSIFQTSVGRKQIVAVTGLALILFLIGHLAGNLFIFAGPEAFNAYAKKLTDLRPALYIVEFGLAAIFLIHIYFTATLVRENIAARKKQYRVTHDHGKRSLATRLMPYTGSILILFVVIHLIDFTFADKYGAMSYIDGVSFGLYGVVYNSFKNPFTVIFYIIAMMSVGLHLSHGIRSFVQTFGFNHPKYTPIVLNASIIVSLAISLGFSSIPLYLLFYK